MQDRKKGRKELLKRRLGVGQQTLKRIKQNASGGTEEGDWLFLSLTLLIYFVCIVGDFIR